MIGVVNDPSNPVYLWTGGGSSHRFDYEAWLQNLYVRLRDTREPDHAPPCNCPPGSPCAERYGAWRHFTDG